MQIVTLMNAQDFVDRYYKPARLNAVEGRRDRIIADRESDLRATGECIISKHDSITGETMVLRHS